MISEERRQMIGFDTFDWHLSTDLTYIYFKIRGKAPKQSGIKGTCGKRIISTVLEDRENEHRLDRETNSQCEKKKYVKKTECLEI